jgi:hypothetical protein
MTPPCPQLDLLLDPIAMDFEAFHKANPQVYRIIVGLARRYAARGLRHLSVKHLYEVARYEVFFATQSADLFKLNNNYTALYARMIEEREPDLRGLFELRTRK